MLQEADDIACTEDGGSMMMRKDNRLDEWFNPALDRLLATTEYRTICNDLLEQHGEYLENKRRQSWFWCHIMLSGNCQAGPLYDINMDQLENYQTTYRVSKKNP